MLLIPCPWCGPRDVTEFRYGSEAGVRVPDDTPELTDATWGEFLFVRSNPKGPLDERWSHVHGCRRWFTLRRDTATDAVLSEPVASAVPDGLGEAGGAGGWGRGAADAMDDRR